MMKTLSMLTRKGFVGICTMLQDYITQLMRTVLPGGHIWQQICISISSQDPEQEEVITQSWRCLTDSKSRVIGRFSIDSITCQLDFFSQRYVCDPLREERALRNLLAEYEQTNDKLDRTALRIVEDLADSIYDQGKYAESVMLVENILLRARENDCLSAGREAGLLETIAYAQYMGKDDLAEENIRNAIALYAEAYGRDSTLILGPCSHLERWLREWGRQEEAAALRLKIEEMTEPDDIDVELNA
jgi:hypothetical protein